MNIEYMLEFHKIREQWMGLALTEAAKTKIAESVCILGEAELRKQLKDTSDARDFKEKNGTPTMASIEERNITRLNSSH